MLRSAVGRSRGVGVYTGTPHRATKEILPERHSDTSRLNLSATHRLFKMHVQTYTVSHVFRKTLGITFRRFTEIGLNGFVNLPFGPFHLFIVDDDIVLTKDKAVATLSCFTLAGCFISELCGFGIGRILSPIKQYNLVLAMLFGWEVNGGPGEK